MIDGVAFTGEGRLIRKATGFEQKKLKPRSPAFGFAGRASRDSGPPFDADQGTTDSSEEAQFS